MVLGLWDLITDGLVGLRDDAVVLGGLLEPCVTAGVNMALTPGTGTTLAGLGRLGAVGPRGVG